MEIEGVEDISERNQSGAQDEEVHDVTETPTTKVNRCIRVSR